MDIKDILRKVKNGEISIKEAEKQLKLLAVKSIGDFAKIDIGRFKRRGIPEIILAEYKHPDETVEIVKNVVEDYGKVIVSRASIKHTKELKRKLGKKFKIKVYDKARIIVVKKHNLHEVKGGGKIGVLAAGTADIPVAEEAVAVAKELGCKVYCAYDVGVAGIHRTFSSVQEMLKKEVDVFIVVAGMEGALPSIVSSLVDCPVIGVPTSTGYGYGGGGIAALMSMLQSCSLGLAVVNIDNGVGAGCLAALIANKISKARSLGQ